MNTSQRSYDSTHYYAARSGATEIKPGAVFWHEQRKGWTFNVLIDGITVCSNYNYPREGIAREAMRLEIDGINKTISGGENGRQ